jgi:hypothetical protein
MRRNFADGLHGSGSSPLACEATNEGRRFRWVLGPPFGKAVEILFRHYNHARNRRKKKVRVGVG